MTYYFVEERITIFFAPKYFYFHIYKYQLEWSIQRTKFLQYLESPNLPLIHTYL